jgi:ferrochelatase
MKIKVVIGQLGSPRSPAVKDVRHFLKEFLGDPRLIDLPRLLWLPILYLFILPFRPKKSAQAYARIWDPQKGFPLVWISESFWRKLQPHLDSRLECDLAFLLADPRPKEIFDRWEKQPVDSRAQEVLVLPQFPQYAESTTASVVDALGKEFTKRVNLPSFRVISDYHRARCFIDGSVRRMAQAYLEAQKIKPVDVVLISFHGIPRRRVTQKHDLYFKHCFETYALIQEKFTEWCQSQKLSRPEMTWSFQSRFGSEVWLGPYTDETAEAYANEKKHLLVYCPSFVVDCLETTDEIGHELKEDVEAAGGHLSLVPCLNDEENWVKDYAYFVNTQALGSEADKRALFYPLPTNMTTQGQSMTFPKALSKQKQAEKTEGATPLPATTKRTLGLMFLTLFLDLMGFSIIFPMFPAMAQYYLQWDGDNTYLKMIFSVVESLQSWGGGAGQSDYSRIVLFGGLLGALYSLLQFVAAPLWGALSDRVGRRPVMIISMVGLALSYVMWFFAGSFTTLILARAIGGFMSGNLSIASAVVADITDEKNRSKGMAVIGIAFALGFILGPAVGGLSTLVNLQEHFPVGVFLGVNPFSLAALISFLLAVINLVLIAFVFPETLPPEKRGKGETALKTANPFKLFRPLPFKGVNQNNLAYFFFIAGFSGMEFTLTFLAVERFAFSSMDNAYMFIFIGLIIGLTQGGYVRRKAHQVGEARMALQGFVLIMLGLAGVGYASELILLYVGLAFLAMGSAMVIPSLTSLTSLFTPSQSQGIALGQFRGLGSLGRIVGPIGASLCYWKFGGLGTYLGGILILILPTYLVSKLPKPQKIDV